MTIQNNALVAEALAKVTPGEILALFLRWNINLFATNSNKRGKWGSSLSRVSGSPWLHRWIICVREESVEEKLVCLIHELFHLYLFTVGLDNFEEDETEEVNRAVENSAQIFYQKHWRFLGELWEYMMFERRLC